MARARQWLGVWLVASVLGACATLNPFKLEHQIAMYHDDLRWGRLPAAEQVVDEKIRAKFIARHSLWGRRIQIVDLEVEHTRVAPMSGTARARYTWLDEYGTEIRETVLETHWHPMLDGSWVCDDEKVISGDPELFPADHRRGPAPARWSGGESSEDTDRASLLGDGSEH